MSIADALPDDRSEISKVYRGILAEPGTMDEKEVAIAMVAMTKFGGIKNFLVKRKPLSPRGFDHAIIDYRNRSGDSMKKSAAWKEIQEEFGGYLKACAETETQNEGNLHYLKQAKAALNKAGATELVERIDTALRDYQMEGYKI